MNGEAPDIPLARLASVREKLLAPAGVILGLGKTLDDKTAAAKIEEIVPDVDRIVNATRDLWDMVDGLAGGEGAAGVFSDKSADEAARMLRHDLRTPIAAIKGYGELVMEDLDDLGGDALRPAFTALLGAANALLAGLESIVDFSSTEADSPPDTPKSTHADAPPDQDADAPPPGAAAGRARETGRILVVDDLPDNRDLLARQLTREGHTVSTADGGREALAVADKEPFDLILLDLMMPDLNGFQVLARLKADGRTEEIPVIMISALDEEDSAIKCIQSGAEDFLLKPFNPVLLRARIGACIERKRARDREKVYLDRLAAEKKKSESLLLNILPAKIVKRINAGEELIADRFENIAVLFSDLVGFTEISSKLEPAELVEDLNRLFSRFDTLAKELGVEKVKTIGDAYMVVAGVPEAIPDPVQAISDMALGMVQALDEVNPSLLYPYKIRIGIHTGPVVAGIIGKHKYVYDIWGATVNVASRYESYSVADSIHVSKEVALALGRDFDLDSRGLIHMRGVGEVETFFLRGRRQPGSKAKKAKESGGAKG